MDATPVSIFTDNQIRDVAIGVGWSIAMALSMIGWGGVWCKIWNLTQAEWVKGAIGVALWTVVSGLMDSLALANRTNLTVLILAGLAGWALTKGPENLWKTIAPTGLSGLALFSMATVMAAIGANCWLYPGSWDDISGYWPISEQLSVSGQSWAPLSLRRASSWGGQFPLQSVGMLFTSTLGGYIYDRSMGSWLIMLAAATAGQTKTARGWFAIAGCLLIFVGNVAVNSTPTLLAAVMLAACYLLRSHIPSCGLIMAGTLLGRTQMIIPMGLLGMWTVWETWRAGGWKTALKFAVATPLLILVLCLPLMILQKIMFDSWTVLLEAGTLNKDYCTFVGYGENIGGRFLQLVEFIPGMLVGIFALMTLKSLRPMAVIALLTLCLMVLTMPEYSLSEWIRYTWPTISALMILGVVLEWKTSPILLTLVIGTGCSVAFGAMKVYTTWAKEAAEGETGGWSSGAKAQLKIPEGRTIGAIVEFPSLQNFKRNKILVLDSFPSMGDVPRTGEPADWRSWASRWGIDYILVKDLQRRIRPGKKKVDTWIGVDAPEGFPSNYARIWYPDRSRGIGNLWAVSEKVPRYLVGEEIIIDMRPEGSPYELAFSEKELAEIKKQEADLEAWDQQTTKEELKAFKVLDLPVPTGLKFIKPEKKEDTKK
jgi:hypothetical protein